MNEAKTIENMDTVVVPVGKESFKTLFIDSNTWYPINISATMLERIKYIAAYRVKPISAITHVAEVDKIIKSRYSKMCEVKFKGSANEITPIPLGTKKHGAGLQSRRYTSYERLLKAKILADLF